MKGFLGSANVDTNSRLCMASTVAGHRRAFGEDVVPGSYEDLDQAESAGPGRLQHRLVPSGPVSAHDAQPPRTRRQDRGDRSAPHGDRRRSRSVSGDRAGHRHRAVLRAAGASRRCRRARPELYRGQHVRLCRGARARARDRARHRRDRRRDRPRRRRRRALLPSVPRQGKSRHLLLAGREPVGAGHRQGQRHHQLPSRHRPHRQARHGAVLADRPAQRDGRARGRRARQHAGRPYGLCAGRSRPGAPLLERAAHGRARRAQGRADVRGDRARRDQGAVGDGAPIPRCRCRAPAPCARR